MAFTLTTNHGTQTSSFGTGTVQGAGHLLVVGLWTFSHSDTLSTLTDTVGTTKDGSTAGYNIKTVGANGSGFALAWGFAGGTGANTLTSTWTGGATTTFGSWAEFSGTSVSGATADGAGATATGSSGTSISTPTYTTTGSDDLVLNFAAPATGGTSGFSFGGSWSNAAVSTSFGGIGYQADVGVATYTPSASWTTSGEWGSVVVAIQAASSGSVIPYPSRVVSQAVNRSSNY